MVSTVAVGGSSMSIIKAVWLCRYMAVGITDPGEGSAALVDAIEPDTELWADAVVLLSATKVYKIKLKWY